MAAILSRMAAQRAAILEAVLVAGIALVLAFLGGFVLVAFRNPVAITVVAVLAGLGWYLRDTFARRRDVALIASLVVGLFLFALLVSPGFWLRLFR